MSVSTGGVRWRVVAVSFVASVTLGLLISLLFVLLKESRRKASLEVLGSTVYDPSDDELVAYKTFVEDQVRQFRYTENNKPIFCKLHPLGNGQGEISLTWLSWSPPGVNSVVVTTSQSVYTHTFSPQEIEWACRHDTGVFCETVFPVPKKAFNELLCVGSIKLSLADAGTIHVISGEREKRVLSNKSNDTQDR